MMCPRPVSGGPRKVRFACCLAKCHWQEPDQVSLFREKVEHTVKNPSVSGGNVWYISIQTKSLFSASSQTECGIFLHIAKQASKQTNIEGQLEIQLEMQVKPSRSTRYSESKISQEHKKLLRRGVQGHSSINTIRRKETEIKCVT